MTPDRPSVPARDELAALEERVIVALDRQIRWAASGKPGKRNEPAAYDEWRDDLLEARDALGRFRALRAAPPSVQGEGLREALASAVDLLKLRPSGHTGAMSDRIPWFTHGGVSHGENRPDCAVCQWLTEARAALAAADHDTRAGTGLDVERLAQAMTTVYVEDLVFPVKGGGPYDWSLDAKLIAAEYKRLAAVATPASPGDTA